MLIETQIGEVVKRYNILLYINKVSKYNGIGLDKKLSSTIDVSEDLCRQLRIARNNIVHFDYSNLSSYKIFREELKKFRNSMKMIEEAVENETRSNKSISDTE